MSQPQKTELRLTRSNTFLNRISSYLFSGSLWVFGSLLYLSTIPEEWWRYRDDSVIHLSEARNFSLYGTIGLSAGDRVEAMSSPLNFAISSFVYGVKPGLSYQKYLNIFVALTLIALSISINFLFRVAFKKRSANFTRDVLVANICLFALTLSSWTTFGWLVSGMENILCVTIFLFLLANLLSKQLNLKWTIALLILLGVCRIELSVLIAPILLFTAFRLAKDRKSQIYIVSIPFGAWISIHSIRFWYFGHLFPNTATALNKNLSVSVVLFIGIQYLVLMRQIARKADSIVRFEAHLNVVAFACLASLGAWRVTANSYTPLNRAVLLLSLIATLVLTFAFQFTTSRTREIQLLFLLLLIPANHYFLFGPARLSAFRIVGIFVIPIISILIIFFYNNLWKAFYQNRKLLMGLAFLILACLSVSKIDKPRDLCCAISPSDTYISTEAKKIFGNEDGHYPLPIVANPDLGKVSFSKNFMNVDLGLIGEPLLARIMTKSPKLVDEYLLNIVAPDVIELHGHWACVYESVLKSKDFKSEWKLSWSGYVSKEMNPRTDTLCPYKGKYSIWARSIPYDERMLSHSIATGTFEEFSKQINRQLDFCNNDLKACEVVSRAIIRNKGKLLKNGTLKRTVKLLEGQKLYEFESLRILQPRGWDSKAFLLIDEYLRKDSLHS
jgi:hypothetical protein